MSLIENSLWLLITNAAVGKSIEKNLLGPRVKPNDIEQGRREGAGGKIASSPEPVRGPKNPNEAFSNYAVNILILIFQNTLILIIS